MSSNKKNVVVVGGGGAGAYFVKEFLRKLDPARHTLTLVNSRPCYIYLPTTVRMAVTDHGHLEKIVCMPYDRLLGDVGKLVVGTVESIEEKIPGEGGHVVLRDGTRLHYDALVLSPGTKLENPLDYPETQTQEDIQRYIDEWRQKIKDAEHIVFSGGGPTSVGEYLYPYAHASALTRRRTCRRDQGILPSTSASTARINLSSDCT